MSTGKAGVPPCDAGKSTDARGERIKLKTDVEAVDAAVEEVEAGAGSWNEVARSNSADAATKDRLSRGLVCAADLKGRPHSALAVGADVMEDCNDM